MPILNWATEPSDLNAAENISGISSTTTSYYKSPNIERAFGFNASCYWGELSFADQSEFWFSFSARKSANGTDNHEIIQFIHDDGAGNANTLIMIGRPPGSASNLLGVYTFDGTSYTEVIAAGAVNIDGSPVPKVDVHIKLDDTVGEINVYEDGTLTGSFSGDTITNGALNQVNTIRLANNDTSNALFYGGVFVADEDTRGIFIEMKAIDANGFHQGQSSGTYTDINSSGSVDDLSVVTIDSSGAKATFQLDSLSSLYSSGYEVMALGVSARVKKGGAGSAQCKLSIRSGTTDYSGTAKDAKDAFSSTKEVFTINPQTSAAWTFAEVDAAEVGIEVV